MIQGNYPQRFFDQNLPLSLPTPAARQPADTDHTLANAGPDQPLSRPRRASAPLRSPPTTPGAATASPPQITASSVAQQFDSRPTLRSVVSDLLNDAIKSLYPTLVFNPAETAVAEPLSSNPPQYRLTPLLDVALRHLTSHDDLDFTDKHSLSCTLMDQTTGHTLKPAPAPNALKPGIDMQAIELAIRSLRAPLKKAFEQAMLKHFASKPLDAHSPDANRWRWLSDTLKDTLRTAALKQPGLNAQQRETLDQIVTYPDRAQRQAAKGDAPAQVFILDSAVSHAGGSSSLLTPDLLITRQVDGRTQVLHATAAGVVTPYDSMQAFGEAWGKNLGKAFVFDALNWKRQEPADNIFDTQAAVILNAMVENIASIDIPTSGSLEALEQAFSRASDPSPWFVGAYAPEPQTLERLREKLPKWFDQSSPAERDTYRQHALALASSVRRNNGRTFLDGIPDIRTYAQQQLDQHLTGKGYTAQDVEVVFKVPVGNMGSGYLEREKMSLVDMALENLAGLPKGEMEVYVRGQRVNDASLPEMLKGLIDTVDIGGQYPQLLKRELLDDSPAARDRLTRFVEQVPLQLAMQALELKLKGEAGITAQGYALIEAIIQPGPGSKQVDGQEITVRPLAFVRKPGATPDVAANMFIIEPLASGSGPHILYRPQLKPALLEFASRDALLEAIRKPGALQDSVLAWLPDDKVRAVYGNGGFHTPNIARFTVFNEFDPPATPKPTTLAGDGYTAAATLRQDLLNGDLAKHWFHSNANSLVTLAEGQSTSDAESRWASYKELGWLLFNTLLPLMRGPGAMAGWLLQLANAENDIKRLSTANDPDPAGAMVDLLVNLGMTLTHAPVAESTPARTFEPFEPEAGTPAPRPRQSNDPIRPAPIIHQDPSAPVTTGLGVGTAIDIRLSSPRGLTPELRAHIDSFKVPAPAAPGNPIAEGLRKGLYQVDNRWYVSIDNHWFRVATDLDGPYVIDEHNKARISPAIARDTQGNWYFDLAPKLRGGMPKNTSLQETLGKSRRAQEQAQKNYQRSMLEQMKVSAKHDAATGTIKDSFIEYQNARKKLKTLRNLVTDDASANRFAAAYAQHRHATLALKSRLDQQLQALKPLTLALRAASEETIATITPRKIGGVDDLSTFKENRSLEYKHTLHALIGVEDFYVKLVTDALQYGVSGASVAELESTAHSGSEEAYDELTSVFEMAYHATNKLLESSDAIKSVFDQWKNDSPFASKRAEEYLKTRYSRSPATGVFMAKMNQLVLLKRLATESSALSPDIAEQFQMKRFLNVDLKAEYVAFSDLHQYEGYSASERKATLTTIIDKYKQVLSDSVTLQEEHPGHFRRDYHQLFTETLKRFIDDAETELVQVVKEEQQLIAPAPVRKDQQAKPQNKRVFKTEHKESLIGTLRPPVPGQAVNIIDVVDPQSGQPIASYSEHPGERGWVKIVRGQPTAPRPVSPPKSWATYKSEAQHLIDGVTKIEQTILFQKKKLEDPLRRDTVSPRDWNDMLEAQANQLIEKAQQAQAAHGAKPETAEWVARWRATADEILQKARQHTADGYLVQTPTAENVDYLWRHGFVDINLVRRDIPTKSGDVFTEYVVRKKNKIDALWYAHFHYPQKGWAREDYTAAHLKTPAQRTKTQKDLIAEAGSNGVVERIIKAGITKPLDERLFLKL
ncbi:dermonecrotic toxin domain-containing protein [Pseudomonas sp. AM4(2022)]|uniref:dermonecrotic toxin domain-containing protein n=1 Tax=Pseudomonas sp. AM4(2022) TaxID=2983408 RepID=UPI002E8220C8|nr:DUF6543 domain-containing protein [Pseudomonas sp. AM4(2022)]